LPSMSKNVGPARPYVPDPHASLDLSWMVRG
jgi:hypothetical protein